MMLRFFPMLIHGRSLLEDIQRNFSKSDISIIISSLEKNTTLSIKPDMFERQESIEIFYEDREAEIEFKCLDSYSLPFVIRQFMGEEVTDSDKVFYFEGRLAQFL